MFAPLIAKAKANADLSKTSAPQRSPLVSGAPLDRDAQAFLGPRFVYDFSRVRVHADELAAQSGGSTTSDGECKDCRDKRMQRRAKGTAPGTAPTIVHEVLRSPSQPLDPQTRSIFESRFGHDFSTVRIHADDRAAESAEAVHALAYTVRRDVVFGAGQYTPATASGQSLLAHELTHVLQQGPGHSSPPLHIDSPDDPREAEAFRMERGFRPATRDGLANGTSVIASQPTLQRKDADPDIQKMEWSAALDMTEKAAKAAKTKATAEGFYKELVVRAARNVKAPPPLKDKPLDAADVKWSWAKTKDYGAFADPKLVDKAPDNYWSWITFNPSGMQKEEAFTASVIFHELDHAAHARALFDEWKKVPAKGKATWVDFYLEHFGKWTEKPIEVKESGMAGALAGLPEKIQPSGIEFRAYVNQFINFFHKVSVDSQGYMGKTVVLFYPLKTQKVSEKISDPSLDVAASRKQLLDYFKSPPVSDKAKQEIIRNRVAAEFRSALVLFRPDADQAQIKKDFQEITDYPVDHDKMREIRKSYKPEAL